jgi:pantothenate kinase
MSTFDDQVFMDEDICRALVVMVAQNVTQIAYLNAIIHGCTRIVFTGNFLRHNEIAMRILSNSLRIWSKGQIHALFMEHEGYFGAVGAFLYSLGVDANGADAPKEGKARSASSATHGSGKGVNGD